MDTIAFSNSLRTLLELRIQFFPTLHNISPTLKNKWEDNLQACSAMMMALLVDEYKDQSVTLDLEIEKLYANNSKNIDKGKLKEIEKEIKEHLAIFNQNLINKKETKFRKDQVAFNNNRAYRWPLPGQSHWRPRGGRNYPWDSETSKTSDNSSVRSSTSIHSANQWTKQHNFFQQRGKKYGRAGWITPTNRSNDNTNLRENPQTQSGTRSRNAIPNEGMSTRNTTRSNKNSTTQNPADFFRTSNDDQHDGTKTTGDRSVCNQNPLNIINLSSHVLTNEEKNLLSLGLSFCPSAALDKLSIVKDIFLFARRLFYKTIFWKGDEEDPLNLSEEENLDLSVHGELDPNILQEILALLEAQETDETDPTEGTDYPTALPSNISELIKRKCKNKSDKFPSLKANPNLWMFVQQVVKEIGELKIKKQIPMNLKTDQMEALNNLEKNHSIVVKPSDKGGNIVLMDKAKYETMCLKILNNTSWYKQISPLIIKMYEDQFLQLVSQAKVHDIITADV